MKLMTSDNTDLMEVSSFRTDDNNLIVVGTIMGAMPVEAVLTPEELRKVFKLLSFKLVLHTLMMFFKKSKN